MWWVDRRTHAREPVQPQFVTSNPNEGGIETRACGAWPMPNGKESNALSSSSSNAKERKMDGRQRFVRIKTKGQKDPFVQGEEEGRPRLFCSCFFSLQIPNPTDECIISHHPQHTENYVPSLAATLFPHSESLFQIPLLLLLLLTDDDDDEDDDACGGGGSNSAAGVEEE